MTACYSVKRNVMKYQWVLFDADETLFSFNSYLGLKEMLARVREKQRIAEKRWKEKQRKQREEP